MTLIRSGHYVIKSEPDKLLRVQSPKEPAEIRHAIVDLLDVQTRDVRIASAYVTVGGSNIFFSCLSKYLNRPSINAIPKTLITSFDFGITEPAALELWKNLPNTTVLVAGAARLVRGSLSPTQAFHPKIYAFGMTAAGSNVMVGSANMTSRGFSINTEAVWVQRNVALQAIDSVFSTLSSETVVLSDELLSAYKSLRKRKPPPAELKLEAERVPQPRVVAPHRLPTFRYAVENGLIDPAQYRELWIQVEALQGGSGNQLELPREGHRFFGFQFNNYSYPNKITIGVPILRAGAQIWHDRLLTWHGNNRMERINLPTRSQGGFDYENTAIMFRRLPDGSFELLVALWDSDLARAWLEASSERQLLFRLGSTNRIVGLI